MRKFIEFINDKINRMKSEKIENVDFSYEYQIMGKCQWCGSDVYLGKFKDKNDNDVVSAYCSNRECKFGIRKNDLIFTTRTGKELTLKQMQKLISGETITAKCISKATVPYMGEFHVVKNDKGYAGLACELPRKKSKSAMKKKAAAERKNR